MWVIKFVRVRPSMWATCGQHVGSMWAACGHPFCFLAAFVTCDTESTGKAYSQILYLMFATVDVTMTHNIILEA